MLCSARELGLGRDHAGLMALRGDFAPGTNFRQALGLDDWRLVVDVTPNRGELLSHLGVARELAPGGEDGIELPHVPQRPRPRLPGKHGRRECDVAGLEVEIQDDQGCPRYMGAVIRGVTRRPLAGVAGHAAAGRRRAADQQRGGRHQLRAARAGAADPRLRPGAAARRPRGHPRRAERRDG